MVSLNVNWEDAFLNLGNVTEFGIAVKMTIRMKDQSVVSGSLRGFIVVSGSLWGIIVVSGSLRGFIVVNGSLRGF